MRRKGLKEKAVENTSKIFPLRMVYQPVFNVKTRKVIGYEALARVSKKPFFPESFFRRTYSRGQVVDFDLACFKIAFSILPKLRRGQVLFVNIEPITLVTRFQKGKEVDKLLKGATRYRRRIVFELTEGMKARDFRLLKKGVSFLRREQCRFALDDVVGIGSKLFILTALKPEYIKIGRELVNGVAENSLHQVLLLRILDIAGKSNSVVIAEGIEKKKDLRWLYEHGISYAQGFYFARPNQLISERIV